MSGTEMNLLVIIWESGFVVKMVLLLLVAMSVFSWTIIIQKNKVLKAVEADDLKFAEKFSSNLGLVEIYHVTKDYPESTMSQMYQTGFEELQKITKKIGTSKSGITLADYFSKYGLEPLERALKKGAVLSNQKLNKLITMLATIGTLAPFVGLFGTVWGIINSFTGLASGGGSIESVAPGIAEALVATAIGLAAAIPAVWFFNIFNNRIGKINSQMEAFAEDYLNLIARSILISKESIPGDNNGV
ncbi:MAG: MotA/TolQ/ExbB proton channel family protein [Bacteriovoracaceae bacterium]|nr:MotA/TolQ/ExbB proton channel family protein [Bacteriovoracaceae bacterium]